MEVTASVWGLWERMRTQLICFPCPLHPPKNSPPAMQKG